MFKMTNLSEDQAQAILLTEIYGLIIPFGATRFNNDFNTVLMRICSGI